MVLRSPCLREERQRYELRLVRRLPVVVCKPVGNFHRYLPENSRRFQYAELLSKPRIVPYQKRVYPAGRRYSLFPHFPCRYRGSDHRNDRYHRRGELYRRCRNEYIQTVIFQSHRVRLSELQLTEFVPKRYFQNNPSNTIRKERESLPVPFCVFRIRFSFTILQSANGEICRFYCMELNVL